MKTKKQGCSYHSAHRRDNILMREPEKLNPLKRRRPGTTMNSSLKSHGFAVALSASIQGNDEVRSSEGEVLVVTTEKQVGLHSNVHTMFTCIPPDSCVQASEDSCCNLCLPEHGGDTTSFHGSETKNEPTTPSSRVTFATYPPDESCMSSGKSYRVTDKDLPCLHCRRSKGSMNDYRSRCTSCGKPCHASNRHPSCPYFQRHRETLEE